jgi:hypothetical protein
MGILLDRGTEWHKLAKPLKHMLIFGREDLTSSFCNRLMGQCIALQTCMRWLFCIVFDIIQSIVHFTVQIIKRCTVVYKK